MGYSPWDRTESDTTEGLHFHINIQSPVKKYGDFSLVGKSLIGWAVIGR